VNKFFKALKIGYAVLQHVEASGVQLPSIKGIPITVIDNAGKAAAKVIIDHKRGL
jgi:hypothetical protein